MKVSKGDDVSASYQVMYQGYFKHRKAEQLPGEEQVEGLADGGDVKEEPIGWWVGVFSPLYILLCASTLLY